MARNQIELKEDELEHDRPQFERQKERLDEHESEVATAEKELHDLEEETRERLAAAAHAKGEFNKYENKIDRVRTRRLKQELKQNERDLKQAEKDIAGLEGERERLEVMKTELKTLVEQSGDEFNAQRARGHRRERREEARRDRGAGEQIEHNTVEFALDVEDMKERGEQIEFVLKSMSEREERQAQFKEQARSKTRSTRTWQMREEKEKLLDQKANLAQEGVSRRGAGEGEGEGAGGEGGGGGHVRRREERRRCDSQARRREALRRTGREEVGRRARQKRLGTTWSATSQRRRKQTKCSRPFRSTRRSAPAKCAPSGRSKLPSERRRRRRSRRSSRR